MAREKARDDRDHVRIPRCHLGHLHSFPISSTAPPGRKAAPRPSQNSLCAWAFEPLTQRTSVGITSKKESVRDWPPLIAPGWLCAPIFFCKRNLPISPVRTTACPTIPQPPFPFR